MISPGAFSVHSLMFNDGNSYALVVIGVTFSNLQTGTTPFHHLQLSELFERLMDAFKSGERESEGLGRETCLRDDGVQLGSL